LERSQGENERSRTVVFEVYLRGEHSPKQVEAHSLSITDESILFRLAHAPHVVRTVAAFSMSDVERIDRP
jgi:hypothetical protein